MEFSTVEKAIKDLKPGVILNCIGIVKQSKEAGDFVKILEVNSIFPRKLSMLCDRAGAKLIHISTDCVFSGRKGAYTERDYPDPIDSYGRTKFLGEVICPDALTLRTSFIGHELGTRHSLLEWFLSQRGRIVNGYSKAIYSGFPTIIFCNILKDIILRHRKLKGLYHIASSPIDKYSLLCLIKSTYKLDVEINKDSDFICNRSLNCREFSRVTGFVPERWEKMVKAMREDAEIYGRNL